MDVVPRGIVGNILAETRTLHLSPPNFRTMTIPVQLRAARRWRFQWQQQQPTLLQHRRPRPAAAVSISGLAGIRRNIETGPRIALSGPPTSAHARTAQTRAWLSTGSTDESKPVENASNPVSSSTTAESYEFQAETRQLLDIVTNSLYTDKEVFLRELVSNASDSLEKLRLLQQQGRVTGQDDVPLEIRINLDEVTSTITISDTGIGMSKTDMIQQLGTIAKSGSKQFIQEQLKSGDAAVFASSDPARGIIGKFGVGFYSAFMVASKVEVRSVPTTPQDASSEVEVPHVWTSDGTIGTYTLSPLDESIRQARGTSVVLHLKEECWDFCDEVRIEKILKRYSNFVNFPIYLNGNRVVGLFVAETDETDSVLALTPRASSRCPPFQEYN
jgi:TNF receptor-associated protein 1